MMNMLLNKKLSLKKKKLKRQQKSLTNRKFRKNVYIENFYGRLERAEVYKNHYDSTTHYRTSIAKFIENLYLINYIKVFKN